MQKYARKIREFQISKITQRFLRFGMLLISGLSLVLLSRFLEAEHAGELGGSYLYPLYIEAIVTSVIIAVAGAILIERSIRQTK